jgi:neutral trehalase
VAQEPPKPDPNELQATMRQAVRLTRWLCQEHYRVVCSYVDAASTNSTGPATDSTDMAVLEEVILAKLKEKGPLEPRELQRSFHALSAQTRNSAIQRLKSIGLVIDDPDGRLAAAA